MQFEDGLQFRQSEIRSDLQSMFVRICNPNALNIIVRSVTLRTDCNLKTDYKSVKAKTLRTDTARSDLQSERFEY